MVVVEMILWELLISLGGSESSDDSMLRLAIALLLGGL